MKHYTNKNIWKHILSAIVLIACIPIVSATPPIPESYWGYATLNGVPAPNGTSITVEVYGTGEVVGNTIVQYPNGGYSLDIIFNDTDTAEDEGANGEDALTWKINEINCSIPAPGTDTATSGGTNGNFNLTATTTIPTIEFSYVPPLGSFENLRGKVTNVTPSDFNVSIYVYVSGWWTKPTFANPLTTIQNDGNWTCNITTGGSDQNATKIKAYLIPNGYTPPQMNGGHTFPSELDQNATASIEAIRKPERIIQFSGYNWTVKSGEILMDPGPNYFSDSDENVWIDQQGQLHLKIVNRDGGWYCAEVYTTESLGYGKYIFYVASRVDQLDKNVVAGLFTWDTAAPEYNYREIDIEFSKWGQAINDNAQYVVQPWDQPENMKRFNMELSGNNSTHTFDWSIDSIFFQSLHDHFSLPTDDSYVIKSWVYTGDDIPPAGEENVRINLWLNNGDSPSDGQEAEVIIKKFEYTQNDTTPPVVNITSPSDGSTVTTPEITVSGTAADDSGIASVTVNGELTDGTETWSKTITFTEGENTITVVATDNEGIITTQTITVTLDTIAPVINSVTLDPADPNTGDNITVTVNATDNVGVTAVTAAGVSLSKSDGADIWEGTITAIEGTHNVNISASDVAGNTAYDVTANYTAATPADNITPVINSVTLDPTDPNTGDNITVTVNATDNVGVTAITADGVSLSKADGADTWEGTITAINGTHTVNISASDAAGNIVYDETANYTATPPLADNITPVINSVTLDPNDPNIGDDITVTVNATDNVGVTAVTADGEPLSNADGDDTWEGTITAINGTHTVNISASDAADNTASETVNYTATTPVPTLPVVLVEDVTAAPNGYAFTSVMVKNVTGLGSGSITVTYNTSVIQVIDVTSGDGNALIVQDWNVNNTAGSVDIAAWDADESHNGDVVFAHVTFHALGEYPDSTPLAISSSKLIDYTSYNIIGHSVTNGTFSIIDKEPPVITDAIATSDVILNDNGRPRTPGTNVTVLNATVLDSESGVVNVTIDLSPIGGSDDQVMKRIAGTDVWTVATTATDGINLTHELVVTATDGADNSNTSVIGLTVLLRGDVVQDGELNSADALYLAKYLVGKESMPSLLVSDMSPAQGDGKITSADALYLAKYLVGNEAAP